MYEKDIDKSQVMESLNGRYANKSKKGSLARENSLWAQFQKLGVKEKFDKWKRAEIELKGLSKTKLQATVYVDGKPIDSKILKGKFKNGCFILKRKMKHNGIPVVWFRYLESVVMLSIDSDGLLNAHTKNYKYKGFMLFMKGKQKVEINSYKVKS